MTAPAFDAGVASAAFTAWTHASEPLAGELARVGEALRRSTVEVHTGAAGAGSGVIWSAGGLIITNAHVARTDDVRVVLWDGRRLEGRVLARDGRRDLAAIAVPRDDLQPAPIGDPGLLRPGDLVIALGHPLGIVGALALGVVHTVDAVARGTPRWLRADIRLAPGNSGGPLADALGRVVGINTLIAGGLGVAVPVTTVARFLGDARARSDSARFRAA